MGPCRPGLSALRAYQCGPGLPTQPAGRVRQDFLPPARTRRSARGGGARSYGGVPVLVAPPRALGRSGLCPHTMHSRCEPLRTGTGGLGSGARSCVRVQSETIWAGRHVSGPRAHHVPAHVEPLVLAMEAVMHSHVVRCVACGGVV